MKSIETKATERKVVRRDGQERHLPEETMQALARGSLGYEERLRALEHMEGCSTCAQAFADLISRSQLLRPAADFSVRLSKSPEQKKRELRRYTTRVSAAACAALILVVSQMWMTLSAEGDFLTGIGGVAVPGITEISEKGSAAGAEQMEKIMNSIRGISNRMVNWGGENSNVTKEK